MPKDPEEIYGTATIAGLEISNMVINQTSSTSVEISIYTNDMTLVPTSIQSYYVEIDPLTESEIGSPSITQIFPYVSSADSVFKFSITGLTSNKKYMFYVQAYKNSDSGTKKYKSLQLSSTKVNVSVTAASTNPADAQTSKSFLLVNAPKDKNKVSIITKPFDAITIPTPTSVSSQGALYPESYYSFGTSLFFPPKATETLSGGGIGFFSSLEGSRGYFILIETTALSASMNRKSIRIVKIDGTEVTPLKDSQVSLTTTFDGLYGGNQYYIDAKVKLKGVEVTIDVYVNGFKISATDVYLPKNRTLVPTQNVSVIATKGSMSYDYVYGSSISVKEYDDFINYANFYQGQFSNDFLDTNFGNLAYENLEKQDIYYSNKNMIDEFGTVVREIQKFSTKFENRPSFPLFWTTGGNKFAKILSSKYSNFGAEAYVLNNASTTIPLADENEASFYIYGNTLSPSGQLEYVTDLADTTYNSKEPVLFQSKWIQTESDAKNLGEWIRSNVVNKGRLVNMEVFGNPLLSVGDLISIKYAYQGISESQRFIITSVNHSFGNGGLSTTISCRLI